MNKDTITVERKTFLDLCAAAEGARAWMAHNAACTEWANRVRADLHNAIAPAVAANPEELHRLAHIQPALGAPALSALELAAQTESLLNLYMEAKRELHLHAGMTGIDPAKFPVVENVRAQIKVVRESIGRAK